MKKILYTIIAMLGMFTATSCGDMLETDNDSMVIDPDLNQKTDSIFYALGIAQAMQQVADQYFFIGEMRGDLATTTSSTNTNLRSLANYSATTANKYDSAYVYYKIINNCNYYLAHRDTTLYTGSVNVTINEYAAVAAWRAWAYLQLARTYCGNEEKIPFFTQPLTAISEINEDNFPKKNLSEIVDALAPSLERYSGLAVPTYNEINYNIGRTNWGVNKNINFSKLFIPVDVILGEMYLEQGLHYDKAAAYFSKYLCDNSITLASLGAYNFLYTGNDNKDVPEDFGSYNTSVIGYQNIYANVASPRDVLTYIPMAVSAQRGQITDIPLSFGYDYYSTTSNASECPRVEDMQIAPSQYYKTFVDSTAVYYYQKNAVTTYTTTIGSMKVGDARGRRVDERFVDKNSRDMILMGYQNGDTTKVYINKVRNANVYLYRETTVYLHLAEALNRMGYPELAFAILRNGISTYLEELVPSETAPQPYQYLNSKDIEVLQTVAPFLNATNRNKFEPADVYGIHNRGAGYFNGPDLEDFMTVNGSQATTVGSKNNLMYLPKPIIGEKLDELSKAFPNVTFGTTKQDSINAMEDILCDEYAMEFAFEGQRFYDLQRMARHKNESGLYGGNFGSVWFAKKLVNNNPQVNLLEPKNWYLPFK